MGILLAPGTRVLDSTGAAISGGKVRVYNANTTTLSSLYSDTGLSVAIPNPVVCSSTGYPTSNGTTPTLVFAADANYDIAFLDAASSVLRSWDDMPSLGEDNSTFLRTLSGGTRLKFADTGGRVLMQVGSASPDDIGGQLTVEGWQGTTGDDVLFDFSTIDTTGVYKENGKKIPGVVYTEATTFAAAPTVDIPLTNSPTGVIGWDIDVWDFVMSATANLYGRFSYDSGANYKAGATDYFGHYSTTLAAGLTCSADLTQAQMELCSNMKGSTARPGILRIRVLTVNSGANDTRLASFADGITNVPVLAQFRANWFGEGSYTRATHLRLLPASGTITGKYRVMPLRGFGE